MRKVSIVVPCFNVAEYLDDCMACLLGQTIGIDNMEIILVDDASTDDGGTWGTITAYEKKYPDIIVAIRLEKNMRQGGARNVGIDYAGGEYLFFCDADDWIAIDALELLYDKAKKYDADVVEFGSRKVRDRKSVGVKSDAEGTGSHLEVIGTKEERAKFVYRATDTHTLGCWNKLYRLSMVQENNIQFIQGVIMEEPSFTLPCKFYINRYYYFDRTLYFYYYNNGSTLHSYLGARKHDNAKVWLGIIANLDERGVLAPYHEELEGLFLGWYLGLNMRIWRGQRCRISPQELLMWQSTVLKLFPNAVGNKYVNIDSEWAQTILGVLKINVTEESTEVINQLVEKQVG